MHHSLHAGAPEKVSRPGAPFCSRQPRTQKNPADKPREEGAVMRVNADAASRLKSGKHYLQERDRFVTIQVANLRPVNQNRGLNDRVPCPGGLVPHLPSDLPSSRDGAMRMGAPSARTSEHPFSRQPERRRQRARCQHRCDVFGPPAIVLTLFGFACAAKGRRRWSDNRRIRKHFQH